MLPPSQRLFLWTAPLVCIGWAIVAFTDLDTGSWEFLCAGLFFGTMFGHTTVAGAWAALGTGPLLVRLVSALLWVVTLAAAVVVTISIHVGPGVEAAVMIGCCLVGQWLLIQLPLWLLGVVYPLKLRHRDLTSIGSDPRDWQFGIRQLMILTAVVAVVLGVGRSLVITYGERVAQSGADGPILAFLAVAAVVLSLPPLLAALLPRYSVWATLGTLLLVGLATAWEVSLSQQVGLGPRPTLADFIAINATTVAWVLIFAAVVRRCGYLLRTPHPQRR